jgi:hypothetical protein
MCAWAGIEASQALLSAHKQTRLLELMKIALCAGDVVQLLSAHQNSESLRANKNQSTSASTPSKSEQLVRFVACITHYFAYRPFF